MTEADVSNAIRSISDIEYQITGGEQGKELVKFELIRPEDIGDPTQVVWTDWDFIEGRRDM